MKRNNNLNRLASIDFLVRMRTILVLVLLIMFFGFVVDSFLTVNNAILVLKHVALYSFIGLGMTFVIITGGIDLSVGSVAGLCGMVAGYLISKGIHVPALGGTVFFNIPVVILICLTIGALIGLINGVFVSHFKLPPFIATLGTMYIARGLANLISGGLTFSRLGGVPERGNQGFKMLGTGIWLGIPIQIWLMILFVFLSAFILNKTVLGNHIYAVGGNIEAAKLSGIDTARTLLFTYVYSGVLACITGLIAASQLVAAHPATGEAWEMHAIAATVLGGTSMSGGIGKVGGTVIGLLVITVLHDGMVMVGVSEFWQKVITGAVVIIAVLFDMYQEKIRQSFALQKAIKNEARGVKHDEA